MIARLTSRARRSEGFTMVAVMIAMLVVTSLSVAAFGAANGDIRLGQRNVDTKKAYAAAEAGIAYYLQKLGQDTDYWTRCTDDPSVALAQNPVNQMWTPAPGQADPRRFKALPTDPGAAYAIELLPGPSYSQCIRGDNESMIDPAQGTLRIRSTGRSNGVHRSVVATLRRNGFLDFIYFTNFETSDPGQQVLTSPNNLWRTVPLRRMTPADATAAGTTGPYDTIEEWAAQPTTCSQLWRPNGSSPGRKAWGFYGAADGRGSAYFDPTFSGQPPSWNLTSSYGAGANIQCSRIHFGSSDAVRGPFHTNDSICADTGTTFGRAGRNDRIEFYEIMGTSDCDGAPNFNGPVTQGDAMVTLEIPESNQKLRETTFSPYVFEGRTYLTLSGSSISVRRGSPTAAAQTMPIPSNGLVYVDNHPTTACPRFSVDAPYADQPGCGDVYVSGTYSKSLTISAKRDVVIAGDIRAASGSDALLGLIGGSYVRVEHRLAANAPTPCTPSTANAPGTTQNRTVEAAILSLKHVFTVDHYQCGGALGTLNVKGAIAQNYRGPVATGSGTTGYVKDYVYDDRLKYRSPPYFMTPVEAAWRAMRTTEQAPATKPR